MGIQSLQDFVDSTGNFSRQFSKYIEDIRHKKTSNLLLIHADSCLKQFYHENLDWICGGQWSEFFQHIEKFVNAFRQSDIELVIFLDGNLNDVSLHQWRQRHRFVREVTKEALSHITHNNTIPFRRRVKTLVPPGSLKTALRLAFRTCGVLVCSSLENTFKESILYGKDVNCLGIIGLDANYILYGFHNYVTLSNSRWLKKLLNSCKIYDIDSLMKDLDMEESQLPYLATLLGNHTISDASLSNFYWDLIEEDHPLKKIQQTNVAIDAVLPPSDTRIRCIAKFITTHKDVIQDPTKLAELVFSKHPSISLEDGSKKIQQVLEYYKDCLSATQSALCKNRDETNHLSVGGFPLPAGDTTNTVSKYKKCWEPPEKSKPVVAPPVPKTVEVTNEAAAKLENPEEVIKQGTLEEAAQALEQLEMKETGASVTNKVKEQKDCAKVTEPPSQTIQNEEKPKAEDDKIESADVKTMPSYSRVIDIQSNIPNICKEAIDIARKRHQSGQMCPEILQLLLKGEIVLDMTIDDETVTSRYPIPLIYRPLRQFIYGVLFGASHKGEEEKSKVSETNMENQMNGDAEKSEVNNNEENQNNSVGEESVFKVKEWCVYGERSLDVPDFVEPKGMSWGVPPLKKLWFGMDSEDNTNRLKAFLSCMKSDTVNMSNTAMVPHRLMLLCCVLRYLVQQDDGKVVLTKHDIDAFLAQALSTQLTSEHNTQNLANIKLSQVDARCIQLAAIFMKGIEYAILANDACGSPVPWEFCCPWNFFDGKLFHSKWLQSTMKVNTTDLCEGKLHIAEKLERLRWCITEGLESKYTITGLKDSKKFFNPFGNLPAMNSSSSLLMRPAGSSAMIRGRGRGAGSRRAVSGNGGTLHVAGVPVAHWNGNKSGIGYSKNAPNVLVGGPASVDLPSDHRRNNRSGRGGARTGRGRGLLETPYFSPWQQGNEFEDYMNSTYQRYMKGVQKAEQVRTKLGKLNRTQVYSSRTRHQQNQQHQSNQNSPYRTNDKENMWLGKGRGHSSNILSPSLPTVDHGFGRGQWYSP